MRPPIENSNSLSQSKVHLLLYVWIVELASENHLNESDTKV